MLIHHAQTENKLPLRWRDSAPWSLQSCVMDPDPLKGCLQKSAKDLTQSCQNLNWKSSHVPLQRCWFTICLKFDLNISQYNTVYFAIFPASLLDLAPQNCTLHAVENMIASFPRSLDATGNCCAQPLGWARGEPRSGAVESRKRRVLRLLCQARLRKWINEGNNSYQQFILVPQQIIWSLNVCRCNNIFLTTSFSREYQVHVAYLSWRKPRPKDRARMLPESRGLKEAVSGCIQPIFSYLSIPFPLFQ